MKYNRRHIMLKAWSLFRKFAELGFSECLHRAWISEKAKDENEQRVNDAKAAAGITEDTDTWAGWKSKGYGAAATHRQHRKSGTARQV